MRSTSVVVSWAGGSVHSERLASSGQIAVDRAPATRKTLRTRSAIRRASAPPLQSSTTSSGGPPRPVAFRRSAVAMNPAHSRSSSVVFPVPLAPMTT
jgi:hypothetical protein